jgi:mono/diheme cytochrome c family protein
MPETKSSKSLILLLIVAALAAAVVIGGCGGGSSSSTEATTSEETEAGGAAEEKPAEEPAEEEAEEPAEETEKEERSGASSLSAEGKTVFTTNCASCHTLKAAGATGAVGPNLDELEPSLATVEHQVVNGGGVMPAFGKEGTLNAKEIKAVATYVSSVAGKG